MTEHRTDVAVIGAGTAGLAAERNARKAGASTLLVDPHFAGTTCATVGCMPSKLLIAAADAVHGAHETSAFGFNAEVRVDGPAVFKRVRALRDKFVQGVQKTIADLPEGTCIKARARFESPTFLALDNGDTVNARAVVIATGASSALPEPYEAVKADVLTNETVFDLEDLPASLAVIGAGPLGLELAQAMSRLGVAVEIFDSGSHLATLPAETSCVLREALSQEFPIHMNCEPEPSAGPNGINLSWDGKIVGFEKVLVAAGRPPVLDTLDLAEAALELDGHGTPMFDPRSMQCGDSPVFIAGDANHDRPVLHEAADEGARAGRNAATWPDVQETPRKVNLGISFTRPEAAVIGHLPDGEGHIIGEIDFADQGRAKVEAREQGILRIHARQTDGTIVGASLCAPGGEHLAHLLAWAIQRCMTATEMLDLPIYHPTLAEGLMTALQDICHQAGHRTPRTEDTYLPGSRC